MTIGQRAAIAAPPRTHCAVQNIFQLQPSPHSFATRLEDIPQILSIHGRRQLPRPSPRNIRRVASGQSSLREIMALSLSSRSTSAAAAPEHMLQKAIQDFRNSLSDDQRQELQRTNNVPGADAVLVFTAKLDSHNRNRKGRSIASNLYSVLQSVRDFSSVVNTFVSSHPEIAALVWGSIQLTMLVRRSLGNTANCASFTHRII